MNKGKEFQRGLRNNSLNRKIFSAIVSLIKKTTKEAESYLDLFCEFTYGAVAQKFYGTYYSNLEESRFKKEKIKEQAIKRAVKKLESLNYIKIKEDERKIYLTKKGSLEFIKYNIDTKREKLKWDGKWRIVIFDIIERKRRIRDLLRSRLKWLGFKELQRSVWIFPYDAGKELKELLRICNIDIIGDIRFLTTEKIDKDDDLKEWFGIN